MQGFVQGRSTATKAARVVNSTGRTRGSSTYDDLKLQAPPIPTHGELRSRMPIQNEKSAREAHPPAATLHASNGDGMFYGTDASDAVVSTVDIQDEVPIDVGDDEGEHQSSSSEFEGDSGDDLSDTPELLSHTDGHLTTKQQRLVERLRRTHHRQATAFTQRYVKGDSYPPTTGGTPSASGLGEHVDPQHASPNGDFGLPIGYLPANRREKQQHVKQQPTIMSETSEPLQHLSRADVRMDHEVDVGFSFGKPPDLKTRTHSRRPGPPLASQEHQSITAQPPVSQDASRYRSKANIASALQDEPKLVQHIPTAFRKEPVAKQEGKALQQVPRSPTAYEHRNIDALERKDGYQASSAAPGSDEMANHLPIELDYNHEQLLAMDFHELQAQSFDRDPNVAKPSLKTYPHTQPLDVELLAISRRPPQDQARFFAGLDIEQWEQAGDWFLGRFGDVMAGLKAARQRKRTAAREFESEVERRYETVRKNRKLTEDKLSEMKASGAKILPGTPKKAN